MVAEEFVSEKAVDEKPAVFNDFSRHPPIEDFVTIDELLKSHAAQTVQKPLICYPETGVSDFEEYSAADIDRYTDAAVEFYIRNGLEPAVRTLSYTRVINNHC